MHLSSKWLPWERARGHANQVGMLWTVHHFRYGSQLRTPPMSGLSRHQVLNALEFHQDHIFMPFC